ncbi:jg14605 [Pararge aegeria aegeria]|uniref:Jg14605 protein n=1 Tax=Pararge aegeria aegeria TaxID=348720 RepID=A0A8S4QX98_9NEOP|nr:jg14605 [Pararge aegeria aegeria]
MNAQDRQPLEKSGEIRYSRNVKCPTHDLQSEIETHRDVYASLTGTGRRLLGSLSSQEDAVMLQRRLDEMNQRWHHLKSKSMAIRNRLESNAEHWSALLLSLRELTEWVIRKETELNALAPPRGDLNALIKQQDDHRAFRRQLEDKRPVVESNLLSGRQYVANEPPLSDTSDTEPLTVKKENIVRKPARSRVLQNVLKGVWNLPIHTGGLRPLPLHIVGGDPYPVVHR